MRLKVHAETGKPIAYAAEVLSQINDVDPQHEQKLRQKQPGEGVGNVGLNQNFPPHALFAVLVLPEHELALQQERAEHGDDESCDIRDMHPGMQHIIAEGVYDVIEYGIERAHQPEFHELPQCGELFVFYFHSGSPEKMPYLPYNTNS